MNMGKNSDYESLLKIVDVNSLRSSLERRHIEQSLMIFLKCFKENGQCCICYWSNFSQVKNF